MKKLVSKITKIILIKKNIIFGIFFILFLFFFNTPAKSQEDGISLPGDINVTTNETLLSRSEWCCIGTEITNGNSSECVYSVDSKTNCSANKPPQACSALVKLKACKANTYGTTELKTPTEVKVPFRFISPILSIKIPGINFDYLDEKALDEEGYINIPFLGLYIKGVYEFALIAASILAVLMITFAGVKYTVSGGNSEQIQSAKKMIGNSIIGLLLLYLSYLTLYTINPNLTQLNTLRIKYVEKIELKEDYDSASGYASQQLSKIKGVIPDLTNGVYSKGLTVPPASSCAKTCMKTKKGERCLDQKKRDMAYEAQLKTGYPAAVMLAQYMVEGPTFGLTCSGKFIPSIPGDQEKIVAAGCNPEKCGPGYTWECTNKDKYKPPLSPDDFKDKNPANGQTINCGKGEKADKGYVAVHGYRCFAKPVSEGNIFAPLVTFYENHKCFKQKKAELGGTPSAFALAVQACGYATAQTYGETLINKMNAYCLVGTSAPEVPDIFDTKTE